jgi:hypothetical protein
MAGYTLFTIPVAPSTFESHNARIAMTTASPESRDELELRQIHGNTTTMVTGTCRYRGGDPSSGTPTDWSRLTSTT